MAWPARCGRRHDRTQRRRRVPVRTSTYALGAETVQVHYLESTEDIRAFTDWRDGRIRRALAVDTETTGLTWKDTIRLVQFGDTHDAYVLRADQFRGLIQETLNRPIPLVFHNAKFDVIKLVREGYAPGIRELFSRTLDTSTLAHLLDPRPSKAGGTGHGLKDLSRAYVDTQAPDTQADLHALFQSLGFTIKSGQGWAGVPIDHPTYVLYAGLDVIFTARLLEVLGPMCKAGGFSVLAEFERQLSMLLAEIEARGILVDVDYTRQLETTLAQQREEGLKVAKEYGVHNVEATEQVRAALIGMGVELVLKTPGGKPSVSREVIEPLAELGNPLALAVMKAKRAGKWWCAYGQAFLDLRDEQDRIHPSIHSMQARTARMSVSEPPLQQLPAGDALIRRCLMADQGHHIISADYAQVELKVLAALADETTMKQAIFDGEDLHDVTARALFGEDFTKAQRKLAKNVGFGRVYGGGAAHLATVAGVPLADAKAAVSMYDRRFPGIKRLSRRLIDRVNGGQREVETPSGRKLPVDRNRAYSALNYLVQSTSRDVLAQAIVDLDDAGLGGYMLLPIHDEVLAQAPVGDAEQVASEIAKVMTTEIMQVPLTVEAEVGRQSWGSLYGSDL